MKLNFTMWRFKGEALRSENKAGGILYGIWHVMVKYHWNFCQQTGASAAIVALDGSQVGDRQISVAVSNPPSRKPRQPGADQQQRQKEQPGRYARLNVFESQPTVLFTCSWQQLEVMRWSVMLCFFSALSLFVCWCCLGLSNMWGWMLGKVCY